MNALWNEIAARANVALTPEQHDLLSRYLDLLVAGNERMNLTRIVNREAAELQHIADALTLLPYLPAGPIRLVDVGSGGGVPGFPLAIARPDAKVVLIESTKKKAMFLEETARVLGLENLKVSSHRAEEAGRDPEFREAFDVATARAVGTLDWLAEWCLPLLKKGGTMLAMKGPKAVEELPVAEHAIRLCGGGNPDVRPADLPGADGHVIVIIRKIAKTASIYPRPSTTTRGKPLSALERGPRRGY